LFDTVDVNPVPPAIVNVSPVLNVSSSPLSAPIVKLVVILLNDKLPEPSVCNTSPFEPSVPGKV